MRLVDLLIPELSRPPGTDDLEITSLTADSRAVTPGAIFVAIPGTRVDGTKFILDAVNKGAIAVVAAQDADVPDVSVPVLRTSDPRRALALMAAKLLPRRPEVAVAVTGTNGKTSVVEFTRQIFAALGRKAASLGTLGVVKPDGARYGSLTTPDPITLHQMLSDLAKEGVTHLAFEASSHGLDQRRLDGVPLSAAAFTNLGRDHLDYHADIDDYFSAKLRLFEVLLEPGRPAIINADDPRAEQVAKVARRRGQQVVTVGQKGEILTLEGHERDGFGQMLRIRHGQVVQKIHLPLLGFYQASNALVAAGLAIATGEEIDEVVDTLSSLKGVNGRLEIVGQDDGALVVVDYAHKPEALQAALQALRPFVTGRLICVFGCGGDRDRGKRPIMGRIATEFADVVIVTDDNPRTESPPAIRAEILAGAPGAKEIGDRRTAIEEAIDMMGPGDVVLIAGKGHETGQIVGDTVLPFSDHDVAREALARRSRNRTF